MAINQPPFARQPIFDAQLNVVAHELLFRGVATTVESATAEVLLSALDQSVFDVHSGSLPVFVNFPSQILMHMPLLDVADIVKLDVLAVYEQCQLLRMVSCTVLW